MTNGAFIIPARKGSKGAPNKNFIAVNGKSLVYRAVEQANASGLKFPIFVSTDNTELRIEELLATIHIRENFINPDTATAADVVTEFMKNNPHSSKIEHVIYLQPTSPLRSGHHIEDAWKQYCENDFRPLVSVDTNPSMTPEKFLRISSAGFVEEIAPFSSNQNRQSLPRYVYPNGAIYIFQVKDFKLRDEFPKQNLLPFYMGSLESLDVDTNEDLKLAEILLEQNI